MPAMTEKFAQLVQANKEKRFLKFNEGVKNKLLEEEKSRRRAEVTAILRPVCEASDILASNFSRTAKRI